jgi:hypothetical protein
MKLLMLLPILALVGCSTGPKYQAEKPQYCHTKQVMVKDHDGTVASRTVVECNDNQVERLFQVQSGMAPNCGEFTYWMRIGGRDVQRKGVSCQKPDGSWEIINTTQW